MTVGSMDGNLSGETRKRACTSKVRTGCITCKERRVKCDEVKPACLRCRKAGQACKGYSPPRSEPRPPKPDPAIRKLLPRQSTRQPTGLAITIGRALPTVRLQGMDALYFDFFRSEAVKELSGYLPSSFWSRTVLCETLTDPCIRHATLALGAALYPLAAPTQYRPSLIGSHAGPNAHARAAICHHTKTLALFREIMANGDENFPSRTAFIVTPLLVAFTMLQRNNQAAEALLSGLRALQEVCHVWQGKQARGDPKSPLVNEEMERLTCLMLQIYMLCGHNPLYPTQKGNVFTMPSTMFLDSNPAPDWGDRPVTAISMDSILTIWFSFTSRCLVWLRHTDYTKHSTMPGVYGNACEEQTNLLVRLDRWQQFIYGLNPAPDLDAACLRGLKLIRLQYETLFIWVSEALDRTRMGFDAHTSRFDIIVQGCAELLGHGFRDSEGGAGDFGTLGSYSPAPQTGFTFEGFGVVSMLGFVITRCRIGPVRQRAIGVLERIWWRENGWDTVASYHGARALMELEEQGGIRGEDGDLHIPAESRYYWGNARWENDLPASQKLICTFAQRRPDELGEVVGVTVLMDLSVPRPST